MTDTLILYHVRSNPHLLRLWTKLNLDERRRVVSIADGDTWNIREVMTFVIEERADEKELAAAA